MASSLRLSLRVYSYEWRAGERRKGKEQNRKRNKKAETKRIASLTREGESGMIKAITDKVTYPAAVMKKKWSFYLCWLPEYQIDSSDTTWIIRHSLLLQAVQHLSFVLETELNIFNMVCRDLHNLITHLPEDRHLVKWLKTAPAGDAVCSSQGGALRNSKAHRAPRWPSWFEYDKLFWPMTVICHLSNLPKTSLTI